ncbi:MAG: hypothetical protein HY909_05825 [Deltaproteobacteria bacterium]|nr:hypothetical protein [Deltaproteobacteria bacterium]
MPLLAVFLAHGALGLGASWCSQQELRASPRAVPWTRGFLALAAHEALVGMPTLAWLLFRHPDWMVGYTFDAARLPSALGLVVAALAAPCALGSYALGAWLLRSQRPRGVVFAGGGALALAVALLAAAWSRVGVVGSTVQFRGGFGIEPLGASSLGGILWALGLLTAVTAGHLGWTLRRAP